MAPYLLRADGGTAGEGRHLNPATRWVWRLPTWAWVAVIVATLTAGWVVAVASGDPAGGSRHLFYIPIVLTAVRFGWLSAAVVGVAATLLAGPLSVSAPLSIWGPRAPFFVGIGVLVALLTRAVLEVKEREAALAERERDVLTQRTMLIESVSHDFRTPLTVIQLVASSLAARPTLLATEARGYAGSLDRATRRLKDLVSVVIAASDGPVSDVPATPVDVEQVVRRVAEGITGCIERLRIIGDPDVPPVMTELPVLELILRCLLDNAVKFSPLMSPVEVSIRRQDDAVAIAVLDRGPGMTREEIRAAFEPFRQFDEETARVHGGVGLGLFSAERLVTRIHGELQLEPRDGGGLVASVVVPESR